MSTSIGQKLWSDSFQSLIEQEITKSNVIPSEWRAGGRVSKAFPEKENDYWWSINGPRMVEDFITWWKGSNWSVYYGPTKTPHIEAQYNVMFGDVSVRAIADLIAVTPDNELVVVDYKTGSYMPDTNMQLGLYAACMEITEGVRPSRGYFYNARQAIMEDAGDLSRWSVPLFTELFQQFEKAIQEEIFLPNLGMMCKSCSVAKYCYAYGGEQADKYDPLSSIERGK